MRLKIFEKETLLGEADVFALDPPMGVATAKFHPTPAYDMTRHANVIDGDYVGDRSDILRVEMHDGSPLMSEAISIHDVPTLGEKEVDLLGIYEPKFNELFAEHPDFKAYWSADIPTETHSTYVKVRWFNLILVELVWAGISYFTTTVWFTRIIIFLLLNTLLVWGWRRFRGAR